MTFAVNSPLIWPHVIGAHRLQTLELILHLRTCHCSSLWLPETAGSGLLVSDYVNIITSLQPLWFSGIRNSQDCTPKNPKLTLKIYLSFSLFCSGITSMSVQISFYSTAVKVDPKFLLSPNFSYDAFCVIPPRFRRPCVYLFLFRHVRSRSLGS